MKLRPTIFLSGVSSEFRSFRDAVENEIEMKGCFAENQPGFHPDYRTVEAMLRQRLREADAVIHIVGFRFGAEPNEQPPGRSRRSYTQMEFDIAREMEKPVYVFLSADASVRDPASEDEKLEDAEAIELQLAHREAIQNTNHLYYFFKDKSELCKLAAEIPQVVTFDFRADISRIDRYAPAELIGREDEFALLNDAWLKVRRAESRRPHLLTFVALGGEGKTSLVAKWAAELAHQGWPGCDAAFAWSFYSQGTREQLAASSDLFLKEAITFFGDETDKQFAASSAGAYDKGQRLARIVSQRRSLLILDGLEPLQYPPTSPTPNELKDAGLSALLKGLAAHSEGLCIVTTRYSVRDLKTFWETTAPEEQLLSLSRDAGVRLLKTLGVRGTVKELESLVQDVKGHALTLNLLGTYLRDAHGGDIRRRDLIKLEEADAEEQSGHAFRVMEAYEQAFENEGDKGKCALAVLRLLGLFDRPVSADCLSALLEKPAIDDLTVPLVEMNEAPRNLVFKRLEGAKLLTVNRDASTALISLDAHPLLREYFAQQLRMQHPDNWRAAHRRLYEHLCATTPDKPKPTLEDLQPLYQAVAHGCQAGLQAEVLEKVYVGRILRGAKMYGFYSVKQLGAFASDLGAVACFFETPWSRVSPELTKAEHAWLLNVSSYHLRALGRLMEALEPMRIAVKLYVEQQEWREAARNAVNLSELELILGLVTDAVKDAKQSVTYADRSEDLGMQTITWATYPDALHHAGLTTEAEKHFREAEQLQREFQPHYPLLYSARGFKYCELLLSAVHRTAWAETLDCNRLSPLSADDLSKPQPQVKAVEPARHFESVNSSLYKVILAVSQRANRTLEWTDGDPNASLLTLTFEHLTQGRTALYKAILSGVIKTEGSKLRTALDEIVDVCRRAGRQDHLPRGLLTRAWFRFLTGACIGPASAQEDLDEAWEIAERGPMRLHMAEIHLYRARLFFREKEYPWESPEADLKAAEKLINDCGYHRRDEELADAKRVILGQSV